MLAFPIILSLISGAMYSFNGIFVKFFSKHFKGDKSDSSSLYSIMLGIIIAIVSFFINACKFRFSYITLIIAAVNCVGLLVHNHFIVKAMSVGPYSIISVSCMAGGIIMPLIVTALAFSDIPTYIQLAGIAVMFIAFIIMCLGDSNSDISDKKKYFLYLVILFVANGVCVLGYSLEKRIEGGAYKQEMIMMEYVMSFLFSFITLIVKKKKDTFTVFRQSGKFYLFAILACVTLGLGNNLQVFSISSISEAVAFTIKNGTSIFLSAILSLLIFSEKIRAKKWVGIAAVLVSICLLAI